MATFLPFSTTPRTSAIFCSGRSPACTASMGSREATAFPVSGLSPVSIASSVAPRLRNSPRASAASFRTESWMAIIPNTSSSVPTTTTVAPLPSHSFTAIRSEPAILEVPLKKDGLPTRHVSPFTRPRIPMPGTACTPVAAGGWIPLLPATSRMDFRERVPGPGFDRRGQAKDLLLRSAAEGQDGNDFGLAEGQCPGLIEKEGADSSQFLEVCPAFEEDPLPGGPREPADDGNGRRDHESAGAGDHQDHESPIKPGGKGLAEHDRGHGDQSKGKRNHRGGVISREPVDERLAAGTLGLGVLHEVDDPRQRTVGGEPGDPDFERSPPVQAPRQDGRALSLRHRDRLPRDRCLVDEGRPLHNDSVDRYPFARPEKDKISHRDPFDRQSNLPVLPEDSGLLGGKVEETPDRVAGAVHAFGLQQLRQREEEHRRSRLRPFPDQEGADRGDGHQRVHLQLAVPRGLPRPAGDVPSPRNRRQEKERLRRGKPAKQKLQDQPDDQRCPGEGCCDETPVSLPKWDIFRSTILDVRAKPRFVDRLHDALGGYGVRLELDGDRGIGIGRNRPADSGKARKGGKDRSGFVGAIHPLDPEDPARCHGADVPAGTCRVSCTAMPFMRTSSSTLQPNSVAKPG